MHLLKRYRVRTVSTLTSKLSTIYWDGLGAAVRVLMMAAVKVLMMDLCRKRSKMMAAVRVLMIDLGRSWRPEKPAAPRSWPPLRAQGQQGLAAYDGVRLQQAWFGRLATRPDAMEE